MRRKDQEMTKIKSCQKRGKNKNARLDIRELVNLPWNRVAMQIWSQSFWSASRTKLIKFLVVKGHLWENTIWSYEHKTFPIDEKNCAPTLHDPTINFCWSEIKSETFENFLNWRKFAFSYRHLNLSMQNFENDV